MFLSDERVWPDKKKQEKKTKLKQQTKRQWWIQLSEAPLTNTAILFLAICALYSTTFLISTTKDSIIQRTKCSLKGFCKYLEIFWSWSPGRARQRRCPCLVDERPNADGTTSFSFPSVDLFVFFPLSSSFLSSNYHFSSSKHWFSYSTLSWMFYSFLST